ncbi:gamma-tubulin complex component 3, partial [Lecanoromycetidae sp. Uapishka_2]
MGDEKSQRLDDALSSLVDTLIPKLPEEDEATVDERREDALDLARTILDGHGSPAVVSDVNHAADLIKKKHSDPNGDDRPSEGVQPFNTDRRPNSREPDIDNHVNGQDAQVFKDAFASAGLPRLPLRETQPRIGSQDRKPVERRSHNRNNKQHEPAEDGGEDGNGEWIYDGELSDPYHEFFVIEHSSQEPGEDLRRAPATSVWEEKYKMDEAMIPSIVTEDFARKVFLIGKSLNFIRYGCGDSAWVEAYCKDASRELKYGDTATLETSIDQAYKATMARLIYLMDDKFQLFEHLNALKRYLLLGQGDFIALLMESLSTNLDKPAGSQYRHTLTAQLEHAIRGSNAQFDSPDILRRLDARLTEMEKGDTGWDVFTLEYKVDAPVDVIITPWANRQYLKIFNLLWRVKRVEFALGSTWRRCMTGARGVLAVVDAKMSKDWKTARCCIAEMIHFVNQLQYYILFEVIEASWDQLQAAVHKQDCTLDDLIEAHTKYLKAITHKGLLGSTRHNATTGHREDIFTVQLHELLKLMLAYKEAVEGLYSFSVAEFTRRQELAAKIETRTAQGKWGLTEKDDDDLNSPNPFASKDKSSERTGADSPFPISGLNSSSDDAMLPALRKRLQDLSADFKTRVNNLLGDLIVQPDVDMKFLAVVMNFNDVYAPRKRRREHNKGGEKKTPVQTGEASKKDAGGGRVVSAGEAVRKGREIGKENGKPSGAIGTATKVVEKSAKVPTK